MFLVNMGNIFTLFVLIGIFALIIGAIKVYCNYIQRPKQIIWSVTLQFSVIVFLDVCLTVATQERFVILMIRVLGKLCSFFILCCFYSSCYDDDCKILNNLLSLLHLVSYFIAGLLFGKTKINYLILL